jgi:4-amino-4-deoxy-L-arabinose transferase-like glycosyltransferase
LAAVFKIFGLYTTASAIVILALNCLCSALTCVPIYWIGRESFGSAVGGWAAWVWALFPFAIFHATNMIWDTCLTTLLFACLFLVTLRLPRLGLAAWAGYGLLWGVTALSNPAVLAVLPVLWGWACYRLHRLGQRWFVPVLVAGMALGLVVFPWFLRNYLTFHQFIPFRDTFWVVFYAGNKTEAVDTGSATQQSATDARELESFRQLGEIGYMQEKKRQSLAFVRDHPGLFAWFTARRFVTFWTGFRHFPRDGIEEGFDPDYPFDPTFMIFGTAVTLLAFAGLWQAFIKHTELAWLYALVLLIFPLLYYVTGTLERYRHTIDPEMVILASLVIVSWLPSSRHPAISAKGTP